MYNWNDAAIKILMLMYLCFDKNVQESDRKKSLRTISLFLQTKLYSVLMP